MKRRPKNKRQHYVPRHYLRLFADAKDRIGVVALDPFRFIGPDSMKSHCQGGYFYGHHDDTDAWLGEVEKTTAPMLRKISAVRKMTGEELVAMRYLAVVLHFRTRKAGEIAKLWPKWVADRILKEAIDHGELPEPPGGWRPGLMDFQGANSMLLRHNSVWAAFEMDTLDYVFLVPAEGVEERFVTSDHPVSILNPFLDRPDSVRSFASFSRAGFQLVLPLGPECCLLFHDPGVYEFPNEIDGTVAVSGVDIDRLNGLQLQAADRCLIVSPGTPPERVERLHERFGGLRKPLDDHLREIQAKHLPEGAVLVIGSNVRLPEPMDGWRIRQNPHVEVDGYRNLAWTEYCERLAEEFEKDPMDIDAAMVRAEVAVNESSTSRCRP